MAWHDDCLDRNLGLPPYGYVAGGVGHPEPTSLCALALGAAGQEQRCIAALDHLVAMQDEAGSVSRGLRVPARWATGLAVLAWVRALPASRTTYRRQIDAGTRWLLSEKGEREENDGTMGHDTGLVGWPWVAGTHSWVIPTAYAVLALKAQGQESHPRCREGVSLLIDRMVTQGGCNYGNNSVLGHELRPHLEPTGIALLALAGEDERGRDRIVRSLNFLSRSLGPTAPAVSLAYGVLGLAAHGRSPAQADHWLKAACRKERRPPLGPAGWALLALAARKEANPFFGGTADSTSSRLGDFHPG